MILALDAGHGMSTAGKRCLKSLDPAETRENFLNRRIASKVIELLKAYKGIEVVVTYALSGEPDVGLQKRCDIANDEDADLFLSIHHNAGANGTAAGGITVYTYTDSLHTFQERLYTKLIKMTGLKGNRSAGCLQAGFHVLKYTKMPACLMELGFMDSSTDVPIILTDAYANQCAEAIVEFVAEEYGLELWNKPHNYVVTVKCGENEELKNALSYIGTMANADVSVTDNNA